jgi:hypothetical protein
VFRHFSCFIFFFAISTFSQIVEFPLGSRVVDVTKDPYLAQGDGKTDDTEAIQRALDDHPDGDFIIYLPHGTYRISKQLSWPRTEEPEKSYRRTVLQGASMGGTILMLADSCRGFDNIETPRAMIYTGVGPLPRYRNAIRNISLRTGKGNPGAIGIRFNAATQGTILNVKIFSGDGQGVAGIDMGFAENIGPLLVKNVEIKGFNVGILTRTPLYGMTLEHIYLSGQKQYGIENHDQALTIRNLRSHNSVPAIYNAGSHAMLTLIDGALEYLPDGKKEKMSAIINEASLFVRSVSTSKYFQAIEDKDPQGGKGVKGPEIIEYASASTQLLCHTPPVSIKLPVAETMETPQQPSGQWVGIQGDYGGTASDGTDDSKAIQQAIDDGAETIYFSPGGRYTINKDIHIRKRIRHIIGTEARIDGTGKFIIDDGTFNEITIERFSAFGSGIRHMSKRTLILRNMSTSSYTSDTLGAGDLYLEDVSMANMTINLQHVWARQLHMNYDNGTKIINNGGTLWILGLTAENGNTLLHNRDQGDVELAGVHVISNAKAKIRPLFINDSANLSIEGLRETAMQGNAFQKIVSETRLGETKTLFASDLNKGPSGGIFLPLYVGYIPRTGENTAPVPQAPQDTIIILPGTAKLSGYVTDDGRADGLCSVPVEWSKISGPGRVVFADQRAYNTEASFTFSGRYHVAFSAHDGKLGAVDTTSIFVFDKRTTTQDHNGDNVASGRGMDTWISEFDSYSPHGKDSALQIGNLPSNSAKIYLKFDLSGLPGPVSDAALQLNVNGTGIKKPLHWNLFGLVEDPEISTYGNDKLGVTWQESELTWANAPANLNLPGGTYIVRQNRGGGIDPRYTRHLGLITVDPQAPFGTFLRSPSLTEFMKRKHKSELFTLILTATDINDSGHTVTSRDAGKTFAPVLYVSYFDSNKTVGGDTMQGGFQMSKVNIDIYTLACSFDLTLGQPQFVQIEIYNEFGKRMMILAEKEMESEKALTFKFSAKSFPTGKYKVKIVGEAFQKEQPFYILN